MFQDNRLFCFLTEWSDYMVFQDKGLLNLHCVFCSMSDRGQKTYTIWTDFKQYILKETEIHNSALMNDTKVLSIGDPGSWKWEILSNTHFFLQNHWKCVKCLIYSSCDSHIVEAIVTSREISGHSWRGIILTRRFIKRKQAHGFGAQCNLIKQPETYDTRCQWNETHFYLGADHKL